MDATRSIEADDADEGDGGANTAPARPPEVGTDERRMHVRAYNFWVSLLDGRAYPSIDDLAPASAGDFGQNAVLLDFSDSDREPRIAHLGELLRRECDVAADLRSTADVPSRSLLSRLTDHYLQILANRAPIGFEAEFVNHRGNNTLYRGILMPFSSDGETIDYVYGVINWKELVADEIEATLAREIERAIGARPAAAWADGPGAGLEGVADVHFDALAHDEAATPLADRLAGARLMAEQAHGARLNSRAALYRALGLAYDFALASRDHAEDYAALLARAGIVAQARAPMTAVVKLVFGADLDKARVTECAAALAHAARIGLPAGRFALHVEGLRGGLKAMVAAERVARRPVEAAKPAVQKARAALRKASPLAHVDLAGDDAEFVLLLGRREPDGRLAVVAPVPGDDSLIDRALRSIAR